MQAFEECHNIGHPKQQTWKPWELRAPLKVEKAARQEQLRQGAGTVEPDFTAFGVNEGLHN